MKTTQFLLPAALMAAAFALTAHAENRINIDLGLRLGPPPPIVVREAPPQPVIERERRMDAPGPGYVWVAGRQTWRDGRWVWVSGGWVRPPQPNAMYVEGRWDARSRNWIDSHWEVADRREDRRDDRMERRDDRRGPSGVELIVQGPPPPRHERMGRRPSPDYMWVDGYWVWRDRRYDWVAGHWEIPPHGRRYYTAPRWENRGGSYLFIEGQWR